MDNTFNGWKNWATWNVALWISNDYSLYSMALECSNYSMLAGYLYGMDMNTTPDGAYYMDSDLDTAALDELVAELA